MKKITVVIWAIITVIIGIVFYDNWEIISNKITLSIRIVDKPLPPLPVFVYFIIFFFFGFIIAYLFNFSTRFKASRNTKKLNATIAAHEAEVAKLKGELNTLKELETPAADANPKADAIIELTGNSLVENPANQPDKSSNDRKESNPAKDSEDKSSKKKS